MAKKILVLLFIFFASLQVLTSQESLESALNNPYNTVYTHLYYLQDDSYRPAISSQSMPPGLDSLEAVDLAIKLKQILDGQGLYVYMNRVPVDENYIDSLTNRGLYVLFPKDLPEVYLEKVGGRWYYSEETVSAIPYLHKQVFPFGTDRILNWLPDTAHKKILGIKIWQFLGIALILALSIFLHLILSRLIRFLFNQIKWTKVGVSPEGNLILVRAAKYLSLVLIFGLIRSVLPMLQLNVRYAEFLQKGLRIAITLLVVLFLLTLLKLVVRRAITFADQTESKMDEQLLPIVATLAKIVIILLGIFQVLHLLEVNVTALIAGISIGGLALALAAQDTVKNLIGSIIIFIDKPFLVGDYIMGSDFEGTVEEVGFRTTRLRGIDTAIISIPNGHIVNVVQKNLGYRKMRMMATKLGLTYNTSPDKIEEFTQGLRRIILNDAKIHPENYYVYFTEFQDSALSLMFRVYLIVESYQEELEVKHAINLKILKLAEELGVSFAFPSTSLYIEQMP